jgi:hypothetical protein
VAWNGDVPVETTRTRLFRGAAGLPPGVAWDGDAPGETTRTRLFRGAELEKVIERPPYT